MENYFKSEKHRQNYLNSLKKASEWQRQQRLNRIVEWDKNPKLCLNCSEPITYDRKHCKFCSQSCAATITNKIRIRIKKIKPSKETKVKPPKPRLPKPPKTGETTSEFPKFVEVKCIICSSIFTKTSKSKKKTCSYECKMQRIKNVQHELVKSGKHQGWKSRTNKEPSYPEKFFMQLLEWKNIPYQREVKIGKYFADFVINGKVLEIDGHQHQRPERQIKDQEKDTFLKENGYSVTRIQWRNPSKYSKEMMDQLDSFLQHAIISQSCSVPANTVF